jgi:hypothetical protein
MRETRKAGNEKNVFLFETPYLYYNKTNGGKLFSATEIETCFVYSYRYLDKSSLVKIAIANIKKFFL